MHSDRQCGFVGTTTDWLTSWRIVSDSSWFDKSARLSATTVHVCTIMYVGYRTPSATRRTATIIRRSKALFYSPPQGFHTFRVFLPRREMNFKNFERANESRIFNADVIRTKSFSSAFTHAEFGNVTEFPFPIIGLLINGLR